MNGRNFNINSEIELEVLKEGLSRKILAYSDQIMLVEVNFTAGVEFGDLHAHQDHEQITYIKSGKFKFTIGNESRVVTAGDCVYMEKNILHGAECLESGVLLDTFTPMRKDFLEK
ncbi:MAG: cupin domain-containing protein [Psychrilyobacter sp.]|uniref:cupin domain-containing protein n=1 Tax=Psychrilyobacter sp. TaxID=2586924 RepID=UPI003C70E4B4